MSMSGFEPWSSGVESHSSVNRATVRCHKQSIWADLKTCLGPKDRCFQLKVQFFKRRA